jgi:nucleoside-diphosphate-sugar epimerase
MTEERFLVTGALGCIGAWTVRQLVREGVAAFGWDLPGEPRRLRLLLTPEEMACVRVVEGDVTDLGALERAVVDLGITHVVHLAALQVPFVYADPVRGAIVDGAGTTVVLEAVRRHLDQIRGCAYASSAAVWGPASDYPPGPLADDAPHRPTTLYGVLKHANEETARIYWQDWRVPSVGLRPDVVYGPGRDQGMSSFPSKAILAAAAGMSYHLPSRGRVGLQFAPDVAAAFVRAARAAGEGAPAYDIGGEGAEIDDLVAVIERIVPAARGRLTVGDGRWGGAELSGRRIDAALGALHRTPLEEGVRTSVDMFAGAIAAGAIDAAAIVESDPLGVPAVRR